MSIKHYRLGCPIWSNREWIGRFFTATARAGDFLSQYSAVFNTVEGNSTFYGLPRHDVVARWRDEAAEDFHFCFKFPRLISHDLRLCHAESETREFLQRMEHLGERLGPFFLQLPAQFGPWDLPVLQEYLVGLPGDFQYAVEVRHKDFFAAGGEAQALDRLLQEYGVDRVILDSRALFSAVADDADTREAQRRKPRLPVPEVVITQERPLVRFIGHPDEQANRAFLEPWVKQVIDWIIAGKTPYIFIHTPNNRQAPAVARLFHELLDAQFAREGVGILPEWPALTIRQEGQLGLF